MCEAKEGVGFYRPRQPQETPFYKLVAQFYPEFERVYEERYQERYGFWRPIIARAVERFLDCGDLKKGFARVRCPKCRHELFVAFSCRGRCVCPSCHQKRALEKAVWVAEEVCAQVAHRQFVFTIPKRLRIYFRLRSLAVGGALSGGLPDALRGLPDGERTRRGCARCGWGDSDFRRSGPLASTHPRSVERRSVPAGRELRGAGQGGH